VSNGVFIDPTFRRVVEVHLAGNLVVTPTSSPLILGIFGPPGEGKTFQVDRLCAEYGLETTIISPGELESENAGHPGQLLRRAYLKAGTESRRGVLVVNDIDTVLGDWGNLVQYTVNRQVVFGQLMALCDYPQDVSGTRCRRVPIILTGNNPKLLYAPLLRPGRTRIYGWVPTQQTRLPIVAGIFPELSRMEIGKLLDELPDPPVSFWADVRVSVWETLLAEWAAADRGASLRRMIGEGSRMTLSSTSYTYGSVAAAARTLHRADIRDSSYVELVR
jgi:ATPase family associated with various cellular activities (AAA)